MSKFIILNVPLYYNYKINIIMNIIYIRYVTKKIKNYRNKYR